MPEFHETPLSSFSEPSKEERQWASFTHLSGLSGLLVPFGSILGPLIIWILKRQEMPFVNAQGKEALNFALTLLIAEVLCIPLFFVIIGYFLFLALNVLWIIFAIVATVKTTEGQSFRYPLTIRFFS